MSGVAQYWEKYRLRNKSPTNKTADTQRLMTDRQSYISFLEIQLEKVSQNSLITQSLTSRIDQFQGQINSIEDRLINTSRLLKLQQNYHEIKEDELTLLKEPDVYKRFLKFEKFMENFVTFPRRLEAIEENSTRNDAESFGKEVNIAMANSERKLLDLFTDGLKEVDVKIKSLEELYQEFRSKTTENSQGFGPKKPDLGESFEISRLNQIVNEHEEILKTRKKSPSSTPKSDSKIVEIKNRIKDIEKVVILSAEKINDFPNPEKLEKIGTSIENIQRLLQKFVKDQKRVSSDLKRLEKKISGNDKKSKDYSKNTITLPSNSVSSFLQARDQSLSDLEEKMRSSFGTFESIKIQSPSFREAPNYDDAISNFYLEEIDSLVQKHERPKSASVKSRTSRSKSPTPRSKSPKSLNRTRSNNSLSISPKISKNKSAILPPKVSISKSRPKLEKKPLKKAFLKKTEKPKPRRTKLEKIYQDLKNKS